MFNPIDYTIPANVHKSIRPPFTLPSSRKGCQRFPLKATSLLLLNATPPPDFDQACTVTTEVTSIPTLDSIPVADVAPSAGNEVVATGATNTFLGTYLPWILVALTGIAVGIRIYEIHKQAQQKKEPKL